MSRYDVNIEVIVETNDEALRPLWEADTSTDMPFEAWVKEGIFETVSVSVDWPGKFWLADIELTVD